MKKALTLFLALVMVLLLSACGSEAKELDNPNGYNSIKFAMAVNGTDTQIDTRVANKFKELVEEASGGVITVDVIIMVRYGSNVVSVAKQVQDTVTGAVESMTGMGAPVVNVHVSGVAFDK